MRETTPLPSLSIDSLNRTVRPESPEGDDFFGLAMGTNGTAAEMRRTLFEASTGPVTWLRHNGRDPIGLRYSPARSGTKFRSPWLGE